MRAIFSSFFFLIVILFSQNSLAQEQPDELLKRITHEMITELRSKDQELKQDPNLIFKIVDKIIVPYVDWSVMSHWVIGRQTWQKASEDQKNRFVKEFRDLLIRTYANTLRAYKDQTVDYYPVRGGMEGKERVQINSVIRSPSQEDIRVSYRLAKKPDGWKVYDISIEGVSLLKGFQSQFSEEIKEQGLDELIERLHKHNDKPIQ
jgi:phospholipid transport system substrate-binding protein